MKRWPFYPWLVIALRYLETLTEIAGDKSHTLVFPLPLDLLEPLLKRPGGA